VFVKNSTKGRNKAETRKGVTLRRLKPPFNGMRAAGLRVSEEECENGAREGTSTLQPGAATVG